LPACIFCVLLKNVEGNSSPLFKVVTRLMFLCQCFCVHISCFFFPCIITRKETVQS
jgi:hypothetical protein